ncbi:MAG: M20/M25/M40 family metallo-hydrolase [Flavobacteriaceae bacterium]|nr:M20/M25/M40 family metallo-hydrolase [Flavobacteriaceae bacterium]
MSKVSSKKIPGTAVLTLLFWGSLFLASCGTVQRSSETEESPVTDSTRTKSIISYLAGDELRGREAGTPGLDLAADYIIEEFKKNGVSPYFNDYRDTLANFPTPTHNVVGMVPGNDPSLKNEFILIGAHYDHIGVQKDVAGDSIANGANDNASGTVAVMELARYFGRSRTNKRSLIFALFSAEEKGLLGAEHLAEKLQSEDLDLYVMLNYEMIGVPMNGKDHLLYLTGYNLSNLADVANRYAGEKLVGFLPQAESYNLFRRSDNLPFHEAFNVPSQTFSSFDFTNFDHYHKVGDEASAMHPAYMAEVINRMIPVVESIANAEDREIKYN